MNNTLSEVSQMLQWQLMKRNAVVATSRVSFEKVQRVSDEIYSYTLDNDYGIFPRVEYYLVMTQAEHNNFMEEVHKADKYRLFMWFWQYMGADGYTYVYRLIQYRG